jgi:hypothetical protein
LLSLTRLAAGIGLALIALAVSGSALFTLVLLARGPGEFGRSLENPVASGQQPPPTKDKGPEDGRQPPKGDPPDGKRPAEVPASPALPAGTHSEEEVLRSLSAAWEKFQIPTTNEFKKQAALRDFLAAIRKWKGKKVALDLAVDSVSKEEVKIQGWVLQKRKPPWPWLEAEVFFEFSGGDFGLEGEGWIQGVPVQPQRGSLVPDLFGPPALRTLDRGFPFRLHGRISGMAYQKREPMATSYLARVRPGCHGLEPKVSTQVMGFGSPY